MNHADTAQFDIYAERPGHMECWDVVIYFGDGTKACSNMPRTIDIADREPRMRRVVAGLKRRGADVCWIELVESFHQPHCERERIVYPVLYEKARVRAADREEWTWR